MATDIINIRDGRVLKQRDITTDYTISVTNVDDGSLQFSSNLKSISAIDDIGNTLLRKVDYWDTLPDLTDTQVVIDNAYIGRTVVYVGEDKVDGTLVYEKGCVYKCIPDAAYTWSNLRQGNNTNILRCIETLATSEMTGVISTGNYMLITNSTGNTRSIVYCSADGVIKMSSGHSTPEEAEEAGTGVIVYSRIAGVWTRTNALNEFVGTFNKCTISFLSKNGDDDCGLGELFLGHFTSASDPSPAFHWELITEDETTSVSPFETLYPVNNTCYLSATPTCFYFGSLEATVDDLNIVLDSVNLGTGQFYTGNVIYFETSKAVNVSFTAQSGSVTKTVNVTGDDVSSAGKYRATIEVLPNDEVSVNLTQVDKAEASTDTSATAYGIRYDLATDVANTTVKRIEMIRGVNSSGQVVENIKEVDAYTSMPCHDLKRCVIKDFTTGNVNYYLFPTNSLYKEDGITNADLTGKDGDVAVEIPKCYLRITKPSGSGTSLTSGYVDYLISTTAIPNPPTGSVDAVIYNGVHPAFRVGGTVVSNSYETQYNPTDGSLVTTSLPLRNPKSKIYVGAFASVRCHHGTDGVIPSVIKATATDTASTSFVTASGNFNDGASYPKLQSGVAAGAVTTGSSITGASGKVINLVNTEARSIAPYRDGDMLFVGLPGIHVVIKSNSSSYPTLMPGGCDVDWSGDVERDYTYTLTGDTTFISGKEYYTRSGEVGSYTYTKVEVVAGNPVTPNTYYNRIIVPLVTDVFTWSKVIGSSTYEYKVYSDCSASAGSSGYWYIKGKKSTDADYSLIATSSSITYDSFTSFAGITWTAADTSHVTEIGISEVAYRLYGGPVNYGTHNASFDWATQADWDDAIAGNPNWALNYRPLVTINPSNFNIFHGNGCGDNLVSDLYFAYTKLDGDKLNTSINAFNLASDSDTGAFVFAGDLTKKNCMLSHADNVWYGLSAQGTSLQDYKLYYDADRGGWTYKDANNNYVVMDNSYASHDDFYFETSDTTVLSGKAYFIRTGTGPDYTYTRSTVAVGSSAIAYVLSSDTIALHKTYYIKSGASYVVAQITEGTVIVSETQDQFFLAGKSYFAYNDQTNIYTKVEVTVGEAVPAKVPGTNYPYYDQSTYYERTSLYEVDAPSIINSQFVNADHRYVELYDAGYVAPNGLLDRTLSGDYGLNLGTFSCDTATVTSNHWSKQYSYSDSSDQYNLVFDHPTLRWKIYRTDTTGNIYMYQSDRNDPCAYQFGGINLLPVSSKNKIYFIRNNFTRRAQAPTGSPLVTTNSRITLLNKLFMPTYATTGSSTFSYSLDNQGAERTFFERKWDYGVYRVEYIDPDRNDTFQNTNEYYLTSDTKFKAGCIYYTRSGSAGAYVYERAIVATGGDVTPYTYYTQRIGDVYGGCWCVVKYVTSEYTSVDTVTASDLDIIMNATDGDNGVKNGYFRPVNPNVHDTQRTYNYQTQTTTNTSMVYRLERQLAGTQLYLEVLFVDETGNIPEYYTHEYSTSFVDGLKTLVMSYTNRWVVIKYTDNTYATLANDSSQTQSMPFGWSSAATASGPWNPDISFTAIKGATSTAGSIGNNERTLRFRETRLLTFKAKSSGRAFNMNARTQQLIGLLMVMDLGSFDVYSKLSRGKRLLTSVSSRNTLYGSLTFSGRTAKLGNKTGEVLYDADIDINILADDFGSTVTKDRTVAVNWRGIENPFGNIGMIADGVIPMKRYINGVLTTGYYECIDPGAYTFDMQYTDVTKYAFDFDDAVEVEPIYASYTPSVNYIWQTSDYATTNGAVTSFDLKTFIPKSVSSTVSDVFKKICSYWSYSTCTQWSAYKYGYKYFMTYMPITGLVGDVTQYSSPLTSKFTYGSTGNLIGSRLQY